MTATARYTLRALLITQLLWAGSLVAQQPLREVIHLPALTLDGSRIDTTTTYDPSRHVYRYQYTVVAAATNKAPIEGFKVDVSRRTTYTQNDRDLVFSPNSTTQFSLPVDVIAPLDTDLAKLFDGGGQSSEVNDFLRYSQPTVNRLKVPAGTTSYNVIIFYGQTVNPATFAATLNGVDVTSKFHPFAGSAEVVNFPIGPGTTKLQLQAVGTKSSGATARDSDTLTFLQ